MGTKVPLNTWFMVTKLTWLIILSLLAYTMFLVVSCMLKQPLLSDLKVAAPIVPGQHLFNNIILLGHTLTVIPPLLLGPWQFLPSFRRSWIVLHRWMGRVYVLSILLNSQRWFLQWRQKRV
ncbi:MAG: DUF2306 domain-containing protein [Xanthomonadales bacterium]|nr:DUF2306 domain-containing protein [Xanthomonadales bacterium]